MYPQYLYPNSISNEPFKPDETRADEKGLPMEYEGITLYLNPIFCQDGIWYAIIPENATIEAEKDTDNAICNAAIASFRLEEE